MLHRHLLSAAVLGALACPAQAHDLWLTREGANYALHQGHTHSSHAGAEVVPYDPAIVKTAQCLKPNAALKPLAPSKAYPVKFTGECTALLVSVSSGYWTKTPWATQNVPKSGIAGVLKSWQSEESIKLIERWTPASAQPLGGGLEITPLSDPFQLAVNDKLTVLVSENGQPKAGVPVAYQGETRGASGIDGRISLRIRRGGMQLISASAEMPLNNGKADTLIRATALQFELPK